MSVPADDPIEALERARARLDRHDDEGALDALLDAWRRARAPALAELVERLSRLLEVERPPLALAGASKHDAWLDGLERARPADLPRLYAALPDTRVGLAQLRVAMLGRQPADPRLSRWLWAWIREVPFQGSASREFYRQAIAVFEALGDARFDAEILAARDGDYTTGQFTVARLQRVGSRTALAAFLRLAAAVEGRRPPTLEPAADALVEQLTGEVDALARARARAEDTSATLLAAVYADPSADGPRLVYADDLQRRGDPRGEFIALQIARAGTDAKPSKRERELLKEYGDLWTDGLAPFILASGRAFRRGFLAACRYCHRRVEPDPIGIPAWATIEALDGSAHTYMSGTAPIATQPHMVALRVLTGVVLEDVEAIAALDRPLAIEHLHLRRSDNRALLSALDRARSLPRLRSLDLRDSGLDRAAARTIAAARPDLDVLVPE